MKSEKDIYTVEEALHENWLDSYEIKKKFNISDSTLYRLRKNKEIPYSRLGRKYIYPQAYFTISLMNKISNTNAELSMPSKQ